MKAKHIPNVLSFSRIPLAFTLPFLAMLENKLWFLGVFAYIGASDVFDGIIARKLKCESDFGEKLDSIGDGVYIVMAIIAVVFAMGDIIFIKAYCFAIFAVLMAIRVVNQVITWKKFRRIGFIHTRSTRWASIPIFIMLPVTVLLGESLNVTVFNIVLASFVSLTAIAQIEETFILREMRPGEYKMSLKSYWEWKRDRDLAAIEAPEQQEVTA